MRYFVNVRSNDAVLVDKDGEEFSDIFEACKYAMQVAAELSQKYPRRLGQKMADMPLALEVLDHSGALIFRTPVY